MRVNNQTKIADDGKLKLLDDSTTKLARTASTRGIDAGAHHHMERNIPGNP